MRNRDLAWRGLGVAVFAAAALLRTGEALGLPAFCLALLGLVLIVQGRRAPAAIRVELGKHRALAQAIRDRRRQRPGHRKS